MINFFKKIVPSSAIMLSTTASVVVPVVIATSVLSMPTAVAQSQSQTLLQMQAMQQEIAELRDMVERQGYQIEQLTRSAERSNQNTQALGATNQYENGYGVSGANNNGYTTNNLPAANPNASVGGDYWARPSEGLINQDSVANTTVNPNSVVTQTPSAVVPQASAPQASVPQISSNSEAYDPYAENAAIYSNTQPALTQPSSDDPFSQGVGVVGQGSVAPVNENDLTPVEERLIGQTPSSAGSAPINQNSQLIDGSQINGSEIVSPTPYQRQQPARQPVPNNVPTAGGVIGLPQTAVDSSQTYQQQVSQPPVNTVSAEKAQYDQGFDLLKKSEHEQAVEVFKQQIASYPNGEYADDAHYWVAESLYVNRDLSESKRYFKLIVDNYQQSSRVPDAMLKTAYIEQEQGNKIEARILLQEIIQFHPRSNAAISAKNRLANL